MLKRLYTSAALLFLPSVDQVVASFDAKVKRLDTVASHLEARIEDRVVDLAKSAKQRRSVHEIITSTAEHLLSTIHAAFDRREKAVIAEVDHLMASTHKAEAARTAVKNFLENL
jgi:hypothetical protein